MLKGDEEHEDDDGKDDIVDTEAASGPGAHGTLRERAVDNIRMLRDFCDGMEYQLQVRRPANISDDGTGGSSIYAVARNRLSRENRLNSMRGSTPPTWADVSTPFWTTSFHSRYHMAICNVVQTPSSPNHCSAPRLLSSSLQPSCHPPRTPFSFIYIYYPYFHRYIL